MGWKNSEARENPLQLGRALIQAAGTSSQHPSAGRCPFSTSFTPGLLSLFLSSAPQDRKSRRMPPPPPAITEARRDVGLSKYRIVLPPAIPESSLKFLPIPIALEVLLVSSYTNMVLVVKSLHCMNKVLGSIPSTFIKLMYLAKHGGSHM